MNTIKVMLVEDSEDQHKIFESSISVFNDKYKDQYQVEYVRTATITEALQQIDGSYDGAIIDLKLGNDEDGGNSIVSQLADTYIRIPIIFVTGWVDLVNDHPSVIKRRARDSESYEVDLLLLQKISLTGLTRIMGGRGIIEKTLSNVFLRNLLPHRDKWLAYGEIDSAGTEKALLRYALSHLLQLLDDDGDRCFPEEVYLAPPLTNKIQTGSIVKKKTVDQWFTVMNPACDLVVRGNDDFKTDRVLLVEIEKETDVVSPVLRDIRKEDSKRSKLKSIFGNNYTDYYHWLPETNFFKGGFLNFRKLSTWTKDEFSQNFESPKIQISPSFVKDMVARFSSYYARQGQPDINYNDFIEKLASPP